MRLTIRCRGVEPVGLLKEQAGRRARFALGRFGPRVERASLLLSPGMGPVGGEVRCVIVVTLSPAGRVRVEGSGDSAEEAVASAVERAGRAVAREVDRRRTAI